MLVAAASFVLLELLPVDFWQYWQFAGILLLNGIGMGLFASPNRAGIMNSLPPERRGVGAGMSATFQNSAMVLSIGIFFTLIILGLASSLPVTLSHGLIAQGVPPADAARVAALPPVSILFAALLGYNPACRRCWAPSSARYCRYESCRVPHRPYLLPLPDLGAVRARAGHRLLRLRHRGLPRRRRGVKAAARRPVRPRSTRRGPELRTAAPGNAGASSAERPPRPGQGHRGGCMLLYRHPGGQHRLAATVADDAAGALPAASAAGSIPAGNTAGATSADSATGADDRRPAGRLPVARYAAARRAAHGTCRGRPAYGHWTPGRAYRPIRERAPRPARDRSGSLSPVERTSPPPPAPCRLAGAAAQKYWLVITLYTE